MIFLVTIATYKHTKTAYFLKEKLESENIDCFFSFICNIELKDTEVQVQVKEEDVENAIAIMLRIKEEYGKDIDNIELSNHIKKIIVPVDFSSNCENACYYAINLAEKLKAEIKLLHVYEDPFEDLTIKHSASYEDYTARIIKDMEKKAKADIVAFTKKIKDYIDMHRIHDVKVHSSIVMGKIVNRIQNISEIYGPDVLVFGTKGKGDDSSNTIGGIASAIIKSCHVPVFAVPAGCKFKDVSKLKILYATDFNEKDHTSLNQLLKIVENFDSDISCIHIDQAKNPTSRERMNELNHFLKKDYSQYSIRCTLIEDEDVYHGLKKFSDDNDISLLSFTTQKKGIFEKLFKPNLFKKILQEANLPLMIFPS